MCHVHNCSRFPDQASEGKLQEGRKKREDKGERGTMASDDAIKKLIGKSKSIEAVTFLEKELKKDVTARLDEQVYRRERS